MFTNQELRSAFQISHDQAATILLLIDGTIKINRDGDERFPVTSSWLNRCYNRPAKHELIMSAINEIVGGFGVEAIKHPQDSDEIVAEYINTGDSYSATIIRDCETGQYSLSTWGDVAESIEREICDDENRVSCGYCGHLTPHNRMEWSDVRCESCGRNVQTGEAQRELNPHGFGQIRILHGYIERALFHRKNGVSYDRLIRAIELLATIVHNYDSDSEAIWSIGESGSADLANMLSGCYWYFVHNHGGQKSDEYRISCILSNVYDPGPMEKKPEHKTPAMETYNALKRRAKSAGR